jgi:glycosyl hydrolase family 106( putative alpha-L-rhamnosidase)
MFTSTLRYVSVICGLTLFFALPPQADAQDSAAIAKQFKSPSRDYASAPLWTWNDMLTEEQIVSSMEDLASQGVKQAFVHPRPGLMTPYLSDDWFRLWKVALREAERLDMNIWIYDENSYPSGFAGGIVSEAMPEARGKRLDIKQVGEAPTASDNLISAFRIEGDEYTDVTAKVKAGEELPKGNYLVCSYALSPTGGWFGGKFYVDLLHPGVTEKFIDVTLEAYRREIGDQFGKRMPGWFTDEPHLAPGGGLHWSLHLPELFEKRWGYSLVENLPSLVRPVGDWKRVRHNYYQLLLEQFIECWSKPCYEYCEKHGIEFTGHYWEHGWPDAGHGGDNMAMYAWHQRPAIDTLMNDYQEGPNAQFGNVRAVLELASVANQMGCERTLCEAYGAGGWDLRFEDMKRIGDWLYVLGVNTLDEHLSYITIRGARKRDHPQSFSYHAPWWDSYHVMAEYFTRLSLIMSQGEQINEILILEPTTAAWMYQGDREKLGPLGDRFQKLVTDLAKAQVEFDLGCEDIIARHGSVDGDRFVVGERSYHTVVLPPDMENVGGKTLELLKAYSQGGGRLLSCGPVPTRVDGSESAAGGSLAKQSGFQAVDTDKLGEMLLDLGNKDFRIAQNKGDKGILFHHRRCVDDGQFVLLVNTSIESACSGDLEARAGGVQAWIVETGEVLPCFSTPQGDHVRYPFMLPPCGSCLLFLPNKKTEPATEPSVVEFEKIPPRGGVTLRRLDPNALPLDFVDLKIDNESQEAVYVCNAAKTIFQKHGLPAGNPWSRAVQFRDELITKTFPDDSGFSASYRFTIEDALPESLEIVVERPDLYTITCNGKPVAATKDTWWLDKAFGRLNLSELATVGENVVTLTASPLTIYHELEPAYVIGDFNVAPIQSGFVIKPPKSLELGSWKVQGMPLYGNSVAYTQEFDVDEKTGKFEVELPKWHGSVAKVNVNGQPAGHIAFQPWELDVTDHIRPGKNTIEVVVVGTLKNTLGPHHAGKMVGKAWPHAFEQGPETGPPPGDNYDTLDYGLFEPFTLLQSK